jgi:outer membrane receptor protein involved in Fe transport
MVEIKGQLHQQHAASLAARITSGSYEPYNFWGYPWNKAEKTNTYEGGLDINLPYVNFAGTYFYSETKDYVYQHASPDVAPNPARQRVRNADNQIRAGIELSISANVAGLLGYEHFELRPYFNYSHLLKIEEQFLDGWHGAGNYGQWIWSDGNIPKTTMGGGIRFRYPGVKLSANLNFTYWGHTPYTYNGVLTEAPGYTIANFSLKKGLIDFGNYGDMEIRLDVSNLFNKEYVYGNPRNVTYYMPGRSFYAALIYNF